MKASFELHHEQIPADRWKFVLRVNGVAFAIGAECASLQEAQRLRDDFKTALLQLWSNMPGGVAAGAGPYGSVPASRLADVETACPCGACAYDWVKEESEGQCPFWPEQGCHQRKAWQNWKKWTHRILGAMNCFKIACEETKSANAPRQVSTRSGDNLHADVGRQP